MRDEGCSLSFSLHPESQSTIKNLAKGRGSYNGIVMKPMMKVMIYSATKQESKTFDFIHIYCKWQYTVYILCDICELHPIVVLITTRMGRGTL